jgi:hypothetical protein
MLFSELTLSLTIFNTEFLRGLIVLKVETGHSAATPARTVQRQTVEKNLEWTESEEETRTFFSRPPSVKNRKQHLASAGLANRDGLSCL